MNTFKIIVAYDGIDYQGWQSQPHKMTVADCLQDAFESVFGKKITLIGASRTDTRVHALGQVATFKYDVEISEKQLLNAWNNVLPPSIYIRSLKRVSDNFHPHRNVIGKTYYYHLFKQRPLPFLARYGWHYPFMSEVDVVKLKKALKLYVGTHDFRSFCKLEEERSTIRTIHSITIHSLDRFGAIRIVIKGDSFLHFQIRRMVGYALGVARRGDLSLDFIQDMLDNPDPQQQGTKADGRGLCLKEVRYSS
jgi:tRNA pseudouridine38-40 synthase